MYIYGPLQKFWLVSCGVQVLLHWDLAEAERCRCHQVFGSRAPVETRDPLPEFSVGRWPHRCLSEPDNIMRSVSFEERERYREREREKKKSEKAL